MISAGNSNSNSKQRQLAIERNEKDVEKKLVRGLNGMEQWEQSKMGAGNRESMAETMMCRERSCGVR